MKYYSEYWASMGHRINPIPFILGMLAAIVFSMAFLTVWIEAIWAELLFEEFVKVAMTALPFIAPHALLFSAWLHHKGDQ